MPIFTSLSEILQEYLRSGPSLRKWTWGLSLMMNTMSAGILLGAWSPSLWKVIFVPDFQPGFTLIVSTWWIKMIIIKIVKNNVYLFLFLGRSVTSDHSPRNLHSLCNSLEMNRYNIKTAFKLTRFFIYLFIFSFTLISQTRIGS